MTRQGRPVFLDLRKIRLPLNAVVSILHRITGVFLILSIPVLLWLLDRSLASPEGFAQAVAIIHHRSAWWRWHWGFGGFCITCLPGFATC